MKCKKLLTALSVGLICCNLTACVGGNSTVAPSATEKNAGTEGFVVNITKNDASGKENAVYTGTYKNYDISEKTLSTAAEDTTVKDTEKYTVALISDEKYYDESFKKDQESLQDQKVTIDDVKDFLKNQWASYINNGNTKGVKEFVKFINDNNINIATFIKHSRVSGITFNEFMVIVNKLNSLKATNKLEGFDLLLISYGKNVKEFMDLLTTTKINFDDLITYMKNNNYTFTDIKNFFNSINGNLQACLTELGTYISKNTKLPASPAVLSVKGDLADAVTSVTDSAIKGVDLVWKVISGTTMDGANDSKHSILSSKDTSWENYTGSVFEKTSSYTYKVTDSLITSLVLTKYTFWLEGQCNAKNTTLGGHWIPDMRLRVSDDKTVSLLMTSGIDVSSSNITNKGTADDVNPYMQIYANVYAKFLGLPWQGVTAGFKTITFKVEGGKNGKCFSMQ